MPQRKTGFKALRQNHKHRMHNLDVKTDLRKSIKQFLTIVDSKNKQEAQTQLKTIYKKLDKAAKRHIINKNTASRRKSRFSKLLNSLA